LPQGPESDSYNIYLFVNIIDDSYGTTVYTILTPVHVTPDNQLANKLATSISNNDPNSPVLQALNSGNLNVVAKSVIALTTVFNIQSISNSSSSSNSIYMTENPNIQNNQMADLRDFMVKKLNDLSVTDISSIKVLSSALSASTQTYAQITSDTAVWRFYFINFLYRKILIFAKQNS